MNTIRRNFATTLRMLSSSSQSRVPIPILNDYKEELVQYLRDPSELEWNEHFFNKYSSFAQQCRINERSPREMFNGDEKERLLEYFKRNWRHVEKILQALPHDTGKEEDVVRAEEYRDLRTGIEFFEEDFISHENNMCFQWRAFKNSTGVKHLEAALIELRDWDVQDLWCDESWQYDSEYDPRDPRAPHPRDNDYPFKRFDLRAVPKSHNWWFGGAWTHEDSAAHFGPKILTARQAEFPLLRTLESSYFLSFDSYFRFSCHCRYRNIHPLEIYFRSNYNDTHIENSGLRLDYLNSKVLHDCKKGSLTQLCVIRSGIQLMEEEFAPYIYGGPEFLEEFKNGKGMRKLEDALKEKTKLRKRGGTVVDLRNVPMTHTWWSEWHRQRSEKFYGKYTGNAPEFAMFFANSRKDMLFSLEFLTNSKEESEISEYVKQFLQNCFRYWKNCLRYKKDTLKIMTPAEHNEFSTQFCQALPLLHLWIKNDGHCEDLKETRLIRSAIKFLEDDVIAHNPPLLLTWEYFKSHWEIREIDEFLKSNMETPSQDMDWNDLHLFPETHFWWPKKEREESEQRTKKIIWKSTWGY